MNIPADLRYCASHEWIRLEGDIATVGISDHAQAELTEVVFVELPSIGRKVDASDPTWRDLVTHAIDPSAAYED